MIPRIGKFTETESRTVSRGLEEREAEIYNGHRVLLE
jgi:hypothetical protein